MEYVTSLKKAKEWGISERRVQILCNECRIEGATKVGGVWLIPAFTSKPFDKRTSCEKMKDVVGIIQDVIDIEEVLSDENEINLYLKCCDLSFVNWKNDKEIKDKVNGIVEKYKFELEEISKRSVQKDIDEKLKINVEKESKEVIIVKLYCLKNVLDKYINKLVLKKMQGEVQDNFFKMILEN